MYYECWYCGVCNGQYCRLVSAANIEDGMPSCRLWLVLRDTVTRLKYSRLLPSTPTPNYTIPLITPTSKCTYLINYSATVAVTSCSQLCMYCDIPTFLLSLKLSVKILINDCRQNTIIKLIHIATGLIKYFKTNYVMIVCSSIRQCVSTRYSYRQIDRQTLRARSVQRCKYHLKATESLNNGCRSFMGYLSDGELSLATGSLLLLPSWHYW